MSGKEKGLKALNQVMCSNIETYNTVRLSSVEREGRRWIRVEEHAFLLASPSLSLCLTCHAAAAECVQYAISYNYLDNELGEYFWFSTWHFSALELMK